MENRDLRRRRALSVLTFDATNVPLDGAILELLLHGRVVPCELPDREVLRLIIGEPEVPLGSEQPLLHLLEMVDGL